jgi:hypothetical protein
MQFILKQNQIFTTVSVAYQGMNTDISYVLIDTGSATSILAVDAVASISIEPATETHQLENFLLFSITLKNEF